ncbi:MAG: lipoate--protein ligase family protein [Chloroflexi bacterium]|nr:lipoate--protein ligase family protein [Chloroflexota bacterium]MCL5075149.1 lipoate--protein ligase family protein [Chloroflexota bacterium]
MQWRLLQTDYADGYTNMAIDEAIMHHHAEGRVPPTLRFYGWRPPCVSIGYFQSLEGEINLERCREMAIDYVRRPTGGRAILHDIELTYSVVASLDNPLGSGEIVESYRCISRGIVAGLRGLGITATAESRARTPKMRPKTSACFDSLSDYEVKVAGRKIVGSAQMRRGNVLLQHGAIPLDIDVRRMSAVLRMPSDGDRSRFEQEFRQRVISVREAAGRAVSFATVAKALKEGFEQAFGITLVSGELTEDEGELAEELRHNKYGTRDWNFRR